MLARLQTSGSLQFERFTEERDCLRERTGAHTESSFDNARFAANVSREMEGSSLPLA